MSFVQQFDIFDHLFPIWLEKAVNLIHFHHVCLKYLIKRRRSGWWKTKVYRMLLFFKQRAKLLQQGVLTMWSRCYTEECVICIIVCFLYLGGSDRLKVKFRRKFESGCLPEELLLLHNGVRFEMIASKIGRKVVKISCCAKYRLGVRFLFHVSRFRLWNLCCM